MELKGFKRCGRNAVLGAAAFGMVVAVAPTAVAQGSTWTMPGVKDELLQNAVDAVIEAAGEDNISFTIYDRMNNQVVYNYTNWIVCGQAPAADSTVEVDPAKPQRVTLALHRPAVGC